MKVRCIATTGEGLTQKSLEFTGNIRETDFQMNIGDIYVVYAISLYRGTIKYLTLTKWNMHPNWNPAELFETVDNRLPPNWYFKFFGYGEKMTDKLWLNAIWGYKELITIDSHFNGLSEREPEDLKIFAERKKEIDEFSNKQS